MLTGKERARFRTAANGLDTTLIIGKGGVTDAVIAEAEILLESKELIKGRVLETSLLTARDASDLLCEATGAEGIQTVGSKFILYRKSQKLAQQAAERAAREKKKSVNPVRAASSGAAGSSKKSERKKTPILKRPPSRHPLSGAGRRKSGGIDRLWAESAFMAVPLTRPIWDTCWHCRNFSQDSILTAF